MVKKMIDFWKS